MKYKRWGPEIWSLIDASIDRATRVADLVTRSAGSSNPAATSNVYAAFDADGTLWDIDLGESFFKFQIKNRLIPLPDKPWEHYLQMKKSGDPRPAYLWLAQINKGVPLAQVRQWAQSCVDEMQPLPIFEDQRLLIRKLHDRGVHVYVVTASVKWAVEPGAALLGISYDRVLGVATQTRGDLVTEVQSGEMTYREGKAKALFMATSGRAPFLCCGNTLGDLQLLESSSDLRLAIGSSNQAHELYAAEEALRVEAKKRTWLIHQY